MAKTPGATIVVSRVKSMRSTPLGVKLAPQPGASGSVGPLGPAVMVVWVPRTPFEVKREANRIAGVRLQKRPAEKRTAVFSSGAQEKPRRGESWVLVSGILVLRLNEPFALRSFGLRIGSFGLSWLSLRRPNVTVRFGRTNHWSCTKSASSFWPKL